MPLPLFIDLTAALAAGIVTFFVARWFALASSTPARPAEDVARAVGEAVRPHTRLRAFFVRRLDRTVASGLLLTVALSVTLVGGLVLGVLAALVRRSASLQHVDNYVAGWGYDHRTASSSSGLHAITNLGSIQIVVGLALALVAYDFYRLRSRWSFLYVLIVLLGMEAIMLSVKAIVGRVRPALEPAAASLGPSFPSGHSATAAAFYAAAALVLGRATGRRGRQMLAGAAVAIAVAVALSRVLLDLHWLSDVIGGLFLGWAWFALCSVAFGGRLLKPTAAVDVAAAEAAARSAPNGGRPRDDNRAAKESQAA